VGWCVVFGGGRVKRRGTHVGGPHSSKGGLSFDQREIEERGDDFGKGKIRSNTGKEQLRGNKGEEFGGGKPEKEDLRTTKMMYVHHVLTSKTLSLSEGIGAVGLPMP